MNVRCPENDGPGKPDPVPNDTHRGASGRITVETRNSREWFARGTDPYGLIEYENANPEVRALYDDFLAVRKTDWINNFWKAIAHHPPTLRRTWERIKEVMVPGALDLVTKQMIYVAVSATNQCAYGVAAHIAASEMSLAALGETQTTP